MSLLDQDMPPSGRQISAARALLGMTQAELASLSNVSVPTLKRMEGSVGAAVGAVNNVLAVRRALESAGIEFTNGGAPGVRINKMQELWQRVVLRDEQKVAGMTAIQKAILEASARVGRPDHGVIWRKQTGTGETIYFFSPDIADLIADELKLWKAVPASLPNLKPGFEKVQF